MIKQDRFSLGWRSGVVCMSNTTGVVAMASDGEVLDAGLDPVRSENPTLRRIALLAGCGGRAGVGGARDVGVEQDIAGGGDRGAVEVGCDRARGLRAGGHWNTHENGQKRVAAE